MSNANTKDSNIVSTGLSAQTVVERSNGTQLKDYGDNLDMENFDLIAKVIYLLTAYELWAEDNTFTFPDGETWGKLEDTDE